MVASDRQKSYADLKRRVIEYEVGDYFFLKLFPWKKVLKFDHKGKLSPYFIVSYQFSRHVGPLTYQLELPLELDRIQHLSRVYIETFEKKDHSSESRFQRTHLGALGFDSSVVSSSL
ncbi:DNA/RNA polymerases superfamily protein [Gossypium australe]|uniref:DNA/RNA polymerases superfamily protein n=1 Tax=Gossypium australe TaxID=47621 RepID=A0A5B6UXQ0_9ROSI|nr:DNA/RNA polymerases superfamily protein [Gossypium australe]